MATLNNCWFLNENEKRVKERVTVKQAWVSFCRSAEGDQNGQQNIETLKKSWKKFKKREKIKIY